jgi:hypothetical protein
VLVRQAIALIVNTPDDTMAIEDQITDGGSATAVGAATGRGYSAHVATCAQTVGFSATHKPGMHHGCGQWRGDTRTP